MKQTFRSPNIDRGQRPLDCGSPAAAFREAALLRACLPLTDFPDKENATFRSSAFDLGQRPLDWAALLPLFAKQPCCEHVFTHRLPNRENTLFRSPDVFHPAPSARLFR
jgi:hypothetical protein